MLDVSQCPICLDDLDNTNLTVLECTHSFHSKCFLEYFEKSKNIISCPICRTTVHEKIKDHPEVQSIQQIQQIQSIQSIQPVQAQEHVAIEIQVNNTRHTLNTRKLKCEMCVLMSLLSFWFWYMVMMVNNN